MLMTAASSVWAQECSDIFSASKRKRVPVQVYNNRNGGYVIEMRTAAGDGKAVNSGARGYEADEIWYLVGTASAFKMYSHEAGMSRALTLERDADGNYVEGAAAMLDGKGTSLCLTRHEDGSYAISPKDNPTLSLNMYGGNGADIKLYTSEDVGSRWHFSRIDMGRTLTLSYDAQLEGGYETNDQIGGVAITVDGIMGASMLTRQAMPAASVCYLPENATFSIGTGLLCHGWTMDFNGAESIAPQSLPAEGLTVKVAIRPDGDCRYQYLYRTPDAKGKPYRIPAIATAPDGTIFAIADNRPCGNDIGYGEVDIKCRISNDNGETWGPEFFVADGQGGTTNAMTTGYGDAAIVADREHNRLLVMMVCGKTVCWHGRWDKSKIGNTTVDAVNRVARVYATYNEDTKVWEWTQPEEVTDHIYSLFLDGDQPTVSSMFIGSGKICQSRVVKKGEYYRLYCSMWTRDGGNRVIYSDDFGGSWHVLGTIADRPAPNGDEPKCEELPDGTVVLSSRKGAGRYFNLFTFADTTFTTGTWGTAVVSNEVEGGLAFGNNSTNGEIMLVEAIRKGDGKRCDLMLQSVPTGDGRRDVTIFYKEMEYNADGTNRYTPTTFAQGWVKGIQPSSCGSAYSTMTIQKDGRVAFLYEEEPGGYSIVYLPLAIEEITGGRYGVALAQ